MKLDVIVPTYNRRELLQKTLRSLLDAEVPAGLEARVYVVDNNSKDDTREVVERWREKFGGRLRYVFEARQGRSHALNAGIAASDGELVGMIDDDEELDAGWFKCVYEVFAAREVDYVGGRCLPRWEVEPPPAWLPADYRGVIGWVDGGPQERVFERGQTAMLTGGNAVIRRSLLERVGGYSTALGRTDKGLLTGEDEDLYQRLLDAGARGLYVPSLVIHHFVPAERITKRYYRRWCLWRGFSLGVLDRTLPQNVSYLWGVPRYLYGRAARAALRRTKALLIRNRSAAENFNDELAVWDLVGYFYGKHFYKPAPARRTEAGTTNETGLRRGRSVKTNG